MRAVTLIGVNVRYAHADEESHGDCRGRHEDRPRAGAVHINLLPLQDPAAPWGGMKASGIGREMGHQGIEAYTEINGIWTGFASASAASTTPTQA